MTLRPAAGAGTARRLLVYRGLGADRPAVVRGDRPPASGISRQLLAERGITVDHVTVYRWVQRFTPEFIEAAPLCRHAPTGTVPDEITTDRAAAYPAGSR